VLQPLNISTTVLSHARALGETLVVQKKEREQRRALQALHAVERSLARTNGEGGCEAVGATATADLDLDAPSEYYDRARIELLLREGVLFRGIVEHDRHHRDEGYVGGVRLDRRGQRVGKGGENTSGEKNSGEMNGQQNSGKTLSLII
jgi:hypothetical protein